MASLIIAYSKALAESLDLTSASNAEGHSWTAVYPHALLQLTGLLESLFNDLPVESA